MNRDTTQPETWWGQFDLPESHWCRWHIGPLQIWARCLEHEWQIAQRRDDSYESVTQHWSVEADAAEPPGGVARERFIFGHTTPQLQVQPALADRAVVVRPVSPLHVPAQQQATLFVSTPLWIRMQLHDGTDLYETPIQRPSDTWFGPSTREGELCYASRTRAQLDVADVPFRPYRAVTPVRVTNRADSACLLDRINLPVTFLSLYRGAEDSLWTEEVSMVRDAEGTSATLEIAAGMPSQVSETTPIVGPRTQPESRNLIRAVSALFG